MKKWFSLVTVLILLLSLGGCKEAEPAAKPINDGFVPTAIDFIGSTAKVNGTLPADLAADFLEKVVSTAAATNGKETIEGNADFIFFLL